MKYFLTLFLALGLLMGCSTPEIKNVDSDFYAHNLSVKFIPVIFDHKEEPTKESPTYYLFTVQRNIFHEGNLIIPKDSTLSGLMYYPENPRYLVVHALQLSDNSAWTPAQGVITLATEREGYANLSHVTIPR